MSEVEISYKKNDFLWSTYSNLKCEDANGNPINSKECDNLRKSKTLVENKRVSSGSDERLENTIEIYNKLLIDNTNLFLGIIGGLVFIYYNIKPKN
jgi:hypothetical protein